MVLQPKEMQAARTAVTAANFSAAAKESWCQHARL